MNQRLDAERKPKSRRGHTRTDEVVRRNSGYSDGEAIQINRFPQHCRVPRKPPLPVVFADKNRRAGRTLRNAYRFEGAAAKGSDSQNLEVVFGDNEDVGELRIARPGTEQPQSSHPRSNRGGALANHATGVRERHGCRPKGDQAAEGTDCIPIRFVVGIAEAVIGRAR